MIQIPGYNIIRQLGKGGMATVYLATQTSVDREVALKVMAPQLLMDPTFGERFLREARISAKLHHRHVVSVFDVGVHGDFHYIAMEFVGGGPVMGREGKPVPLRLALRCVREIASALDYAHSKGFIHRDVKPDNILLREDGSCVLSDFGIARAFDSSTVMTQSGSVVGTPHYMSPEALRGLKIDGRADLYSLGVVFYQLLTGQVPYQASDSLAIGIMHMTAPLPVLPRDYTLVQPLLQRMMAKQAGERVQSGAEVVRLVQQIEAQLSDDGTAAPVVRADRQRDAEATLPSMHARRGTADDELELPAPGRMRTEPHMGRMDELALGGAQRSSARPVAAPRAARAPAPRGKVQAAGPQAVPRRRKRQGGGSGRWMVLIVLMLGGLGAWLYRAPLMAWLEREFPLAFGTQAPPELPQEPEAPSAADWAARRTAAAEAVKAGRWFGTPDSALAQFAALRTALPDDRAVLEGYASAVRALGEEVQRLLKAQNYAAAQVRIDELSALDPAAPQVTQWLQLKSQAQQQELDTGTRVQRLLADASDAFSRDRLLTPVGQSAVDHYKSVLKLDPNNQAARNGLNQVGTRLLAAARKALESRKAEEALSLLDHAANLGVKGKDYNELRERALVLRKPPERQLTAGDDIQLQAILEQGRAAIASGQWVDPPGSSAFDQLRAAQRIERGDPRVEQLEDELVRALERGTDDALAAGEFAAAAEWADALKALGGRSRSAGNRVAVVADRIAEAAQAQLTANPQQATYLLRLLKTVDRAHPAVARLERQLGG